MIELPQLFSDVLARNSDLAHALRKTLNTFEPWLEQSGMPFFPGFTDHSPRHISDVLKTAASLLSDSSRALISPEDVAVLCLSILLHDCGMHLTQDSFRVLVDPVGGATPKITGLNDRSWHAIWIEFLREAQRFGQDKLLAVFGDSQPLDVGALDLGNLDERDCLLVGEFVRRHHARLAHEIALDGVPTKSTVPLRLIGFDAELSDLAGLIARSHGMSIRATFPYLEQRYGRLAEYRRVKVPFLMAILRIADYVQVQGERALKSLLSVKELRSPISRQEWRNHFAVRDISVNHEDPEAMYVHAAPADARTFLRLERLFKDIQREMDDSWATLGEVYGRLGEFSALGLSVRRLRSNIDQVEKFSKSVSYIPVRAGFRSSGPDLLKLLVGPLYEYEHSVAIRELVQNAVDACREREDLEKGVGEKPTVIVEISESDPASGWVTVTDTGVGMTLKTVTDYFLVAGASFRNSDVWKRQHISDEGAIRVVRGGRFGVGALAAFLLGDEIKVRTRHFTGEDSDGIEFSARMDDDVVELRRCVAPAGTSIQIMISDSDVLDTLRPRFSVQAGEGGDVTKIKYWREVDWFAQLAPAITYKWTGQSEAISPETGNNIITASFTPQAGIVPQRGEAQGWGHLKDPMPYSDVLWCYPSAQRHEDGPYEIIPAREITVNGIRVQNVGGLSRIEQLDIPREAFGGGLRFSISRPAMAIFDPAGVCPINLQRNSISFDKMGVDERLAGDIAEMYFSHLMSLAADVRTWGEFADFSKYSISSGAIRYAGQLAPFAMSNRGVFLLEPNVVKINGISRIYFIDADGHLSGNSIADVLDDDEVVCFRVKKDGIQARLAWFRDVFAGYGNPAFAKRATWFPDVSVVALIDRISSGGSLSLATWNEANEKGRVRKDILGSIGYDLQLRQVVASSGEEAAASRLNLRLEVLRRYSGAAEIYGWVSSEDQTFGAVESFALAIWRRLVSGDFVARGTSI
jgi:molecular chaperone HtpG